MMLDVDEQEWKGMSKPMKRRGKAPGGWWGEVSSGGGGDKKGGEVGGLQGGVTGIGSGLGKIAQLWKNLKGGERTNWTCGDME